MHEECYEESIIITNCGVSVSSWLVWGGWLYLELLGRSSSFCCGFFWIFVDVHHCGTQDSHFLCIIHGYILSVSRATGVIRQADKQNCLLQSSLGSSPGWIKIFYDGSFCMHHKEIFCVRSIFIVLSSSLQLSCVIAIQWHAEYSTVQYSSVSCYYTVTCIVSTSSRWVVCSSPW